MEDGVGKGLPCTSLWRWEKCWRRQVEGSWSRAPCFSLVIDLQWDQAQHKGKVMPSRETYSDTLPRCPVIQLFSPPLPTCSYCLFRSKSLLDKTDLYSGIWSHDLICKQTQDSKSPKVGRTLKARSLGLALLYRKPIWKIYVRLLERWRIQVYRWFSEGGDKGTLLPPTTYLHPKTSV